MSATDNVGAQRVIACMPAFYAAYIADVMYSARRRAQFRCIIDNKTAKIEACRNEEWRLR